MRERNDTPRSRRFRLGLVINPLAGIGGSVGLKGSDGDEVVALALSRGGVPRAEERTQRALSLLVPWQSNITVYCFAGGMGGDLAQAMGFVTEVIGGAHDPHA